MAAAGWADAKSPPKPQPKIDPAANEREALVAVDHTSLTCIAGLVEGATKACTLAFLEHTAKATGYRFYASGTDRDSLVVSAEPLEAPKSGQRAFCFARMELRYADDGFAVTCAMSGKVVDETVTDAATYKKLFQVTKRASAGSTASSVPEDPQCADALCKKLRQVIYDAPNKFAKGEELSLCKGEIAATQCPASEPIPCSASDGKTWSCYAVAGSSAGTKEAQYQDLLGRLHTMGAAFKRAMPGWTFSFLHKADEADQMDDLFSGGPAECTFYSCPIRVRVWTKKDDRGQIDISTINAQVFPFDRAKLAPLPNRALPRPAECDAFCSALLTVLDSRSNGFASLRGGKDSTIKTAWTATVAFPGAELCVVDVLPDKTPTYDCFLRKFPGRSHADAFAAYDEVVRRVAALVPEPWSTKKESLPSRGKWRTYFGSGAWGGNQKVVTVEVRDTGIMDGMADLRPEDDPVRYSLSITVTAPTVTGQ